MKPEEIKWKWFNGSRQVKADFAPLNIKSGIADGKRWFEKLQALARNVPDLNKTGIKTYKQLASLSKDDVEALAQKLARRPRCKKNGCRTEKKLVGNKTTNKNDFLQTIWWKSFGGAEYIGPEQWLQRRLHNSC